MSIALLVALGVDLVVVAVAVLPPEDLRGRGRWLRSMRCCWTPSCRSRNPAQVL
jgi:hypothetical protein